MIKLQAAANEAQAAAQGLVDFSVVRTEVLQKAGLGAASDVLGYRDVLKYRFENFVASNKNAPFYVLAFCTLFCIAVFGRFWQISGDDTSFLEGCWVAFQVVAAGGQDSTVREPGRVATYFCLLMCGIIIFAILIGMITESFQESINTIVMGKTTVAASGHTLLLGWNESTLRSICQICFLRHNLREVNSTFARKWLRIGRVKVSTPLAKEPVVIMCNTKSKVEMEADIEAAFAERGISEADAKIGWDIVCRVGDPTNITDLIRVGAARATSILVQMTDEDEKELSAHAGAIHNGMTLRTLLALRFVLFSASRPPSWDKLRIVVQVHMSSKAIEAATFTAPGGRRVVHLMDISVFLNSLMLACTAQPGLATVFMGILGFQGAAMRARRADQFPDRGASIIGKTMAEAAFAWEDGIIMGAIGGDGDAIRLGEVQADQGIAPRGSRVIEADDRIIFLSRNTAPKPLKAAPEAVAKSTLSRRSSVLLSKEVNVLIVGWRRAWNNTADFVSCVEDIATRLEQGSHITFMTHHTPEEFSEVMAAASTRCLALTETKDGWTFLDWATISHTHGDAGTVDDLQRVMEERIYHRAVIMPDRTLPPYSRDTRVVTVMLFMRFIQEKLEQPALSIVAENAMDQTAKLAIGPMNANDTLQEPDFVNTQAIQARALAQCLAYPRVEPAISELISYRPNSPDLMMFPCADFMESGQSLTFYEIQGRVKAACEDDICIGWFLQTGELRLCPLQNEVLSVRSGTRLVLVSRGDQLRRCHLPPSTQQVAI